jgi:Domain of Unknown Function (DUF1080)
MRTLDTLPRESWRGYQRDIFPEGSWVSEGGMLHTVAEAEPIDLITRQQYRHFELTLEWRVARGGNSGVLYRVTEALPHAWQSGLKCSCSTMPTIRMARRQRRRQELSMG